jgi:ABC-type uncharacterized transport system ATPase subunit
VKLELCGMSKRYGATVACDAIDLEIRGGEVLALLGENGAGKSTLMKMLYGVEQADAGEIRRDGERVQVDSPRAARELGVGMVFQQFSLIPAFSVAENLSLGAPGLPLLRPFRSAAHRRALAELRGLLPELDPETPARELGVGEKQLVELAKALARGARVLILDEPTSVLSRPDAARLWRKLRELAAAGQAVVLITHKLDDVAACADRVVVLRAGRVVHESTGAVDREGLVRAMLGGAVPRVTSRKRVIGARRLEVNALAAERAGTALRRVSFEVAAGEVLGIAGVTGNGQELLGRVLAGVTVPLEGQVELDGASLFRDGAPAAIARSIAYVPDQPLVNGSAGALSVLVNLWALKARSLPFWLDFAQGRREAAELIERFDVRPRELGRPAGTLSGGNLQKLVIARELAPGPKLLVACFPTMGLDVAAAAAVTSELLAAAERGAAVVWISEDLDALMAHADRVAVLHRGELRGPVAVTSAVREQLGAWMSGAAA